MRVSVVSARVVNVVPGEWRRPGLEHRYQASCRNVPRDEIFRQIGYAVTFQGGIDHGDELLKVSCPSTLTRSSCPFFSNSHT